METLLTTAAELYTLCIGQDEHSIDSAVDAMRNMKNYNRSYVSLKEVVEQTDQYATKAVGIVRAIIKESCAYRIFIDAWRLGNNANVWDDDKRLPWAIILAHYLKIGRSGKSLTNFFSGKLSNKVGFSLYETNKRVLLADRIYKLDMPNLLKYAKEKIEANQVTAPPQKKRLQGKYNIILKDNNKLITNIFLF